MSAPSHRAPSHRAERHRVVATAQPGLAHRADVQGLRAVAVALVVLDHLGGLGVPGGYLGVDVFLVLSGYLITALLLAEVERTGRVSLRSFWARRARRILPAASLVTIATVVAAVQVLPLLEAREVVVDALWATGFAANIRFALVGTDYFAAGEPTSPLQHYWSLSVEEQFYVLWPLLLLLAALAAGRRSRSARRTIAVVVLLTVTLSFAWSVHAAATSPVTAYFSTFARAWELGVGAGCAVLLAARPQGLPRRVAEPLALLGVVGVAVPAVVLDAGTPFPGWAALAPVLAAAALVVSGAARAGAPRTVVARVLGWRPLTVLGDWSYSIYLVHWPVLVLVRAGLDGRSLGLVDKALLCVVVVGLGALSFRFVETPFRSGLTWRRTGPALAIYPVCLALVLTSAAGARAVVAERLGGGGGAAVTVGQYAGRGLGGDRYVELVEASVLAAHDGRAVPGDLDPPLAEVPEAIAPIGACDYRTGTREVCPLGDPTASRTVVLVGDSHARALSPAVVAIGEDLGYRVVVLVYSGCMTTAAVQVEPRVRTPWQACEDFKRWSLETIGDISPELVVVSTHAGQLVDPATGDVVGPGRGTPREDYRAVLEAGYRDAFTALAERAGRVVVVGGTPRLSEATGTCLTRGSPDLGDCLLSAGRAARAYDRASYVAARESGAGVVDARRWFCVDDECPAVVGSFVTMRDREHVTPDYARWLAPALGRALGLRASDDGVDGS